MAPKQQMDALEIHLARDLDADLVGFACTQALDAYPPDPQVVANAAGSSLLIKSLFCVPRQQR